MRPAESFVGQSIRSLQTMLRVISEAGSGIPSVVPDGIYGQKTMNAVTAFQRRYDLPVTGITDQTTWDRIYDIYDNALILVGKTQPVEVHFEPNQVLRRGDRNPYVYLVQAMLRSLSDSYPAIDLTELTGTLDADTAAALAAFQRLTGLPATGELDRVTWKHLSHQFTLNANHNARF